MATKSSTTRVSREARSGRFLTADDAKQFRKTARAYTKKATKSKESAKTALARLKIYTRTGKLAKNYR